MSFAAELLNVWEYGRRLGPVDQTAHLLRAGHPYLTSEEVENLSLGQKEALLLQARQAWFGEQLASVAACPACGERVEFSFTAADLGAIDYPAPPARLSVTLAGRPYQLTLRSPTLGDWRQAAGSGAALFQRCVLDVQADGEAADMAAAPEALADAAAHALQQADPLLEIELDLTCPACGQAWAAPFDARAFIWQELETWAWRTLHTVHRLAAAYGWSEGEILRLSAWRRQFYLALLDGAL